MATYNYPAGNAYLPGRISLRPENNNQVSVSPLNGFAQTSSLPGARWGWSIEWSNARAADRPLLEGMLIQLSGREHRLRLYDFKRQQPLGTINTSGVTASAAAQFANTITLNGCGAGATLLAGDWFAVGGQLLMCVVSATANGSGVMTVEFRHLLRAAVAGGAAVTLIRPTALYILTQSSLDFPRVGGNAEPPVSADFVEVFQ